MVNKKTRSQLRSEYDKLCAAYAGLLRESGAVQWMQKSDKGKVMRGRKDRWLADMKDSDAFEAFCKASSAAG